MLQELHFERGDLKPPFFLHLSHRVLGYKSLILVKLVRYYSKFIFLKIFRVYIDAL